MLRALALRRLAGLSSANFRHLWRKIALVALEKATSHLRKPIIFASPLFLLIPGSRLASGVESGARTRSLDLLFLLKALVNNIRAWVRLIGQ